MDFAFNGSHEAFRAEVQEFCRREVTPQLFDELNEVRHIDQVNHNDPYCGCQCCRTMRKLKGLITLITGEAP